MNASVETEVAERLRAVRGRIDAAAARAGRAPDAVRLVGVSKRQPVERVAAAVRAGLSELGENYVQEARAKREALRRLLPPAPERPEPRWRMIGALQRNKAGAAVEIFDAVDTLDRESLAAALDRRAAARGMRLEVCAQVNLSGEAQKAGCSEDALEPLLAACAGMEHLLVIGLMTIPAASEDPEAARPVFRRLRALREALRGAPGAGSLAELSMGMSGDFEVAVEEGATLVRVGTALFGPRDASPSPSTAAATPQGGPP